MNKGEGDNLTVFPSAHDFDGFSNGSSTYQAPMEKRGKSSWDSGTSSSIGSPNSSRPVKPIGPLSHRPAGSGYPSPGSVGQDRPKQKQDHWGYNTTNEIGSTGNSIDSSRILTYAFRGPNKCNFHRRQFTSPRRKLACFR